MRFKKHYYQAVLSAQAPEFEGVDALLYRLPKEYYSRGSCQSFIERNNLDMAWPDEPIPKLNAVCSPECFCTIYRRQIIRHIKKLNFYRVFTLAWFGFERMRRSVAERYGEAVPSRRDDYTSSIWEDQDGVIRAHPQNYYIPQGYRLRAFYEFLRTFFHVLPNLPDKRA